MIGRSLVTSVLSALVIGFAFPAAAAVPAGDTSGPNTVAESKEQARADKGKDKSKSKSKDKALEKRFPMKAEEFKRRTEARLIRAREKVAGMLEKRNLTEEERQRALARFDEGAQKVRAAADQAGKDGTVTLDEAKRVLDVAKAERKAMKEEVAEARKDKAGKGKGKGKKGKA